MGVVNCYCGCVFSINGEVSQCPYCAEPACLPNLSDKDAAEMQRDLDLMLKYPILAES